MNLKNKKLILIVAATSEILVNYTCFCIGEWHGKKEAENIEKSVKMELTKIAKNG